MCALADILRSRSPFYSFFRAFLAHFPALLELKLTIYVLFPDNIWGPNTEEKSYETLLERLSPVASHLRSLEMGVFNTDEEVYIPRDGGTDRANKFLIDVLPASDFKDFRRLEKLVVPYQVCLDTRLPHPILFYRRIRSYPPHFIIFKLTVPRYFSMTGLRSYIPSAVCSLSYLGSSCTASSHMRTSIL